MPSFQGPMLTLGAMYVAGQSERGRRFTGGESGKGVLAGGFGAASSEYMTTQARSLAGINEDALSDELLQAGIGALISRYGGMIPQNKAVARGIHYNAATQAFQDAGLTLGDLAGDIGGGNNTTQAAQQVQQVHQSNQMAATAGGGNVMEF